MKQTLLILCLILSVSVASADAPSDYISAWLFEENTGTNAADENTTSANDATLQANAGWTSSGKYGNALELNATTNSYALVQDSGTLENHSDMCICLWVNYSVDPNIASSTYISKFKPPWTHGYAYAFYATWDNYRASATDGTDYDDFDSDYDIPLNADQWYHFAVNFNSSYAAFYQDGVAVGTDSGALTGDIMGDSTNVFIGKRADSGVGLLNGTIDEIYMYNRFLTPTEINDTRDDDHSAAAGTPDPTTLANTSGTTWVNHTWSAGAAPNVTDSYNVSINTTWHNTTTNTYYNNTPIPSGNWSNITVWAFNSTYSELSSGSISEDVQTSTTSAPAIASYAPLGNIWREVQNSQKFNVTVNQTMQCKWYVNGTLKQTNNTPSLMHAYTNTSLSGGGCNVTAVVNNTNGIDTQTWLFEVGADSISYIVIKDQPTNQTLIAEWNITRIGSNVTDWGVWQNHTFNGWKYVFRFTDGTEIMNQTATNDNESMWFNHTSLLPTGVYHLNTISDTNQITLYANEYALVNNWNVDQTYQQVDTNISNAIDYVYYNSTSELREAYRAGFTYNHDAMIPKNCSLMVSVNSVTTISAITNTGGITILQDTQFYGYLPGSISKTLAEIKAEMDVDGLDVWSITAWDNVTGAYTDTESYSVAPNEGYVVRCNVTGEYTP